jgi:hypothetical protein
MSTFGFLLSFVFIFGAVFLLLFPNYLFDWLCQRKVLKNICQIKPLEAISIAVKRAAFFCRRPNCRPSKCRH